VNAFLDEELKSVKEKLTEEEQKTIKNNEKEINQLKEQKEETSKKSKFYESFINNLFKTVDLEKAENSPYPEYLTERILMSYMIKTLNTKKDVENL